jgi:hypothetical protein
MSNIKVFYLHYSKFNIRCSIFFHTSFLNLMILAAGEERVVERSKDRVSKYTSDINTNALAG